MYLVLIYMDFAHIYQQKYLWKSCNENAVEKSSKTISAESIKIWTHLIITFVFYATGALPRVAVNRIKKNGVTFKRCREFGLLTQCNQNPILVHIWLSVPSNLNKKIKFSNKIHVATYPCYLRKELFEDNLVSHWFRAVPQLWRM